MREKEEPKHVATTAVPEFETLVVPVGSTWMSLARTRGVFEHDVLPPYLARTRWYPERSAKAIEPTLTSAIPFCDIGDNRPYLGFFEATPARNYIALRVADADRMGALRSRTLQSPCLAAVRQGAREGTLLDVATDQIFIALLLRNLRNSLTVEDEQGGGTRLEFRPTAKFPDGPVKQPEHIRAVETEQSNSTALVDNDYVVKIYRKLEAGINPEVEVGRFLTEVAGFANSPALLGSVEFVEGERRSAVAVVHAFIQNQGDAWTVTSAYLDRFVDEQRVLASGDAPAESEEQTAYLRYMSQTGRRVAEMHVALASRDDDAAFAPERRHKPTSSNG